LKKLNIFPLTDKGNHNNTFTLYLGAIQMNIRKLLPTSIKLSFLTLLSACGGLYVVNPVFDSPKIPDKAGMDLYGKKTINTESKEFINAINLARASKLDRNNLIIKIKLVSDSICTEHLGDIKGNSSAINITLGTLTTLFAGVASISSGTAASTLAASASASNASRSLINEEIYRQVFSDSIIRAIEFDRSGVRNEIKRRMGDDYNIYTIEEAIYDLQIYHDKCSFINGVGIITEAVKIRTTPSVSEKIDNIKKFRDELEKTEKLIGSNLLKETDKKALQEQYRKTLLKLIQAHEAIATTP
jgi:hypothetical protein